MYFKYYQIENNRLAIKETKFVHVEKSGKSYMILPDVKQRECELIDATIGRLAALLCEPLDVCKRINALDFHRSKHWDCDRVSQQMGCEDYWYDAFMSYETLEEANAEMERIAEAIARGDKLYDFTKER